MKPLIITETAITPFVYFNNDEDRFLIVGKSIPKDEQAFYASVIKWLENYLEETQQEIELNIILEMINKGSEKYLYYLFKKLESHYLQGQKILVKWYCEENDKEMLDVSALFIRKLQLPIKNIIIESINNNRKKLS